MGALSTLLSNAAPLIVPNPNIVVVVVERSEARLSSKLLIIVDCRINICRARSRQYKFNGGTISSKIWSFFGSRPLFCPGVVLDSTSRREAKRGEPEGRDESRFAIKLKRNLDVICHYWDKSCHYWDKQTPTDVVSKATPFKCSNYISTREGRPVHRGITSSFNRARQWAKRLSFPECDSSDKSIRKLE